MCGFRFCTTWVFSRVEEISWMEMFSDSWETCGTRCLSDGGWVLCYGTVGFFFLSLSLTLSCSCFFSFSTRFFRFFSSFPPHLHLHPHPHLHLHLHLPNPTTQQTTDQIRSKPLYLTISSKGFFSLWINRIHLPSRKKRDFSLGQRCCCCCGVIESWFLSLFSLHRSRELARERDVWECFRKEKEKLRARARARKYYRGYLRCQCFALLYFCSWRKPETVA